ncbi:hypothetical protein LTR78_004963 [Recurvomyces mirabilis]|uniref:Bifunctional cytochrome P450/NADPH--P450 reductase n=2 Tax=Recurvomyces mirabilis TaxID=574656 RepID=A0AAE1C1Y3_9PEZI|nr:hypothetical protein LTR78_004963 [Recurvomyces mirabilis]
MTSARENIPSPSGYPLIGNILDVQDEVPIRGVERMIDLYGPIVKLNFMGTESIFIGSAELVEELCDEKRFWKKPPSALSDLANKKAGPDGERAHRGMFSAPSEEDPDWQQAHRTLMPAFGPLAIQGMFDEMHDIASQLVLKWARMGPDDRIPVTSDFTRLTLDTIALCAMDFRFNSFYQDDMHPFIQAMNSSLSAASDRSKIGSMLKKLLPWDRTDQKVAQDREFMRKVSREMVQHRQDNPTEKNDLLNAMIHGKDPKTGERMPDGLIGANMVTFLIAGHETTSGLLSFAFLNLLQNPETYFKAQEEVKRVIGRGKMRPEHLKELKYIDAVLRETLRLTSTIPAFVRSIRSDNPNDFEHLLGGKYAINRSDPVICLIGKSQRDPKVYGDDANEFKPERMMDDNFVRLPKGAWKPFGTGVRACIGRAFAWQEAQMVMGLLLQNFNFRLDDPAYKMKVKQTLTIKPEGFYMRAALREGVTATSLQATLSSPEENVKAAVNASQQRNDSGLASDLNPMTILYGSNTGTCMSLAQKLSIDARANGYRATVMDMDAAVDVLPKDQPVVIITASYEGQPPDNADHFITWLERLQDKEVLNGVHFTVFGCGHSDWTSTYQRIPTLCDDLMADHGGERIVDRGLSNAADGNMFSDFDTWADGRLWPAIAPDSAEATKTSPVLDVEMSSQDRTTYLRQDVQTAKVLDARCLTAAGEPEKRHLEVELPENMHYEAGDYLAILPLNPLENVRRVQKHFSLPVDATLTIKPGAATFLPTGVSISIHDLLRGFVELSLPATKKDLQACIAACQDSTQRAALEKLAEQDAVTEKHISLLDLLDSYSATEMTFSTFLAMLPPLRTRHYSISSSPLANPEKCTITYAIINEAAKSGLGQYIGVTSSYLAGLKAGDDVLVSVRSTNKFFHLPADPETTPIMMLGAGTGLAPFRAFIQERATQVAAGRSLAPAMMFMGCRSSDTDRLYASEIDAWAAAGTVDVRYAFSRDPEHELASGCKYISDRMLRDKDDVRKLWRAGAKVFTCGSPAVSESVGRAAIQILKGARADKGERMTDEEAKKWFAERRNERFVVDVFA